MVGTAGTSSRYGAMAEIALDREIEAIAACASGDPIERDELRRRLHAERWGPGRFGAALRDAVDEGRVSRLGDGAYGRSRGTQTAHDAEARPT
jgi:hypothetical protein